MEAFGDQVGGLEAYGGLMTPCGELTGHPPNVLAASEEHHDGIRTRFGSALECVPR